MAKFCSECGTSMPDNAAFCPNCGAVSGQPIPSASGGSSSVSGAGGRATAGGAAGKNAKIGTIIKVIALVLCVLFFLPLVTVSCAGAVESFSGLDSAIGKEYVSGNFLAILMLLIPVALFVIFQFKKKRTFIQGKVFVLSTVLSVVGLVIFIAYPVIVIGIMIENVGEVLPFRLTPWYFLSVILYIVNLILSIRGIRSAKSNAP
jgi:hypothetical protein